LTIGEKKSFSAVSHNAENEKYQKIFEGKATFFLHWTVLPIWYLSMKKTFNFSSVSLKIFSGAKRKSYMFLYDQ
jgi:hypothetical protein